MGGEWGWGAGYTLVWVVGLVQAYRREMERGAGAAGGASRIAGPHPPRQTDAGPVHAWARSVCRRAGGQLAGGQAGAPLPILALVSKPATTATQAAMSIQLMAGTYTWARGVAVGVGS